MLQDGAEELSIMNKQGQELLQSYRELPDSADVQRPLTMAPTVTFCPTEEQEAARQSTSVPLP